MRITVTYIKTFTEIIIHGNARYTLIANIFLNYGFMTFSYNIIQIRKAAQLSVDEE